VSKVSDIRPTTAEIKAMTDTHGIMFLGLGFTDEWVKYYRFGYVLADNTDVVFTIKADKTPEELDGELAEAKIYLSAEGEQGA